jgi:two-component system, OmpR family, phosphate regulon sensor histidine kinase PhoR
MPEDTPVLEAQAVLERNRLTSLINSMADGVIAIDDQFKVVLYNGAALNVLDLNSTITGKDIGEVVKLYDKHKQQVNTLDIIKSVKVAYSTRDLSLIYADKSIVKLYLSIAPVHLGYGHEGTKGYVLLLRDITREKSLEEERDEFISVTSHELRTPVAIAEGNISNALLLAQRDHDPDTVLQALSQAHDQINFLSGLINDLSTLSRAEGGRLQLSVEAINTHELIQEIQKSYTSQAEAKNLKLLTEIDPRLEILKSSKLYVREILQNFVTNALKYTQTGNVTIGAKPATNGVEFWVSDTGIGISKADQEKIFNKFYRSEDFRTRQHNGTGLGLYVTAKLANLLKANISLASELNKGSKFTITIPNLEQPTNA